MATCADIVRIAKEVVKERVNGKNKCVVNGVTFNLTEKSMCSKFVRQVHAAATGVEFPSWAGLYAVWTERELVRAGKKVSKPFPGCIVCFNQNLYNSHGEKIWEYSTKQIEDNKLYGHIGILVDNDMVAENTSANGRGNPSAPGTKITPITAIGRTRVSGYYCVVDRDQVEKPVSEIPDYAKNAVEFCEKHGIMSGDWASPIKRYDLAVILVERLPALIAQINKDKKATKEANNV